MSGEQKVQVPSQQREADTSGEMAKEISLATLADDLQPCAAQWWNLGTQLNIPHGSLANINGEDGRVHNCFREVLRKWLQTESSPTTKKQLLEVLRKSAMGPNERLAKKIEDNKKIPPVFTEDHLSILLTSLDSIAADYNTFGIQLNIPYETVRGLEQRVTNVQQYLQDMLHLWLNQNKPLSDLVDAVRRPPIQYEVLAKKLEEKYNLGKVKDDDCDGPVDIN